MRARSILALFALLAPALAACEAAPCSTVGRVEACLAGARAAELGAYDQPIGSASTLAVAFSGDDVFLLDFAGTLRHLSFSSGALLDELPLPAGQARDALVESGGVAYFAEHALAGGASTVYRYDPASKASVPVLAASAPFTDLVADGDEVFALAGTSSRLCTLYYLDGLGAEQSVPIAGTVLDGLVLGATELVYVELLAGELFFTRRARANPAAAPTRIAFLDPEGDDFPLPWSDEAFYAAGAFYASTSDPNGSHMHRLDLSAPVADELLTPSLRLRYSESTAGTEEGVFVDGWDFPLGSADIGYANADLTSAEPVASLGYFAVGQVRMAADGPAKLVVAYSDEWFHDPGSTDRVHLLRFELPW